MICQSWLYDHTVHLSTGLHWFWGQEEIAFSNRLILLRDNEGNNTTVETLSDTLITAHSAILTPIPDLPRAPFDTPYTFIEMGKSLDNFYTSIVIGFGPF